MDAYSTGSQPPYDSVVQQPEGRIHPAGEHAGETQYRGWLQGAPAPGLRAMEEIDRSCGGLLVSRAPLAQDPG